MSESETGVMTSREHFTVGLQKTPVPSQPVVQNMRLIYSADGAAIYKPATSSYLPSASAAEGDSSVGGGTVLPHGLNMNTSGEPMKKKRGRPRKYGPDGNMSLALTAPPSSGALTAPPSSGALTAPPSSLTAPPSSGASGKSSGGFSPPPPAPATAPPSGGSASANSSKKARGRPPGSISKKHPIEALGPAGTGFTPHIIVVNAGEDVVATIISFSRQSSKAVCVMSANGAISSVALRQPASSGGTVTHEGPYEILSLSGSFLLSEKDGHRSRTGGLSVSLSDADGHVLGGSVVGLLVAASPVQIVLGTFIADGHKELNTANQMEPLSAPPKFASGGMATGTSSPPSRGTLSESSGGPGSPVNQSNNSNSQGMTSMPWK